MRWLMNLLRRGTIERDLTDEYDGYVALLEQEKLRQGMAPAEARRAALVEAEGEHVKDAARDARSGAVLESVLQDIRYGIRSLRRTPGFTLAAVLALGLGIGASAAIFSVVDAVLLRPLPYQDPDRLVVVMHDIDDAVSPANFLDWRRQSSSFSQMGGASYWTPSLLGDRPERLLAVKVTSDVPAMLGVQPLLGRLFTAQNDTPEGAFEVVISHRLWQRLYAGDRAVLGRAMTLDGRAHTIIGVMPEDFEFPPFWAVGAQLWAPLVLAGQEDNRGSSFMRVFARLRDGVGLETARAEIAGMTAHLAREYPGTNRNVTVTPMLDVVVGRVRPAMKLLLGAVLCVLLIGCANVAHMMLARSAAREREIAVRVALGAGRARVVRQMLTESLLLALAGGAAGLLLALAGTRLLIGLSAGSVPRADGVGVNGTVLLLTAAITLLTGIAFGLAPALQASGVRLYAVLRDGVRSSASGGRRRLRSALIVSEFALALMLLAGAGLLLRSFIALRAVDPGWNPAHVVSMVVTIQGSAEAEPGRRAPFFQQLIARVSALPGVEAASAINHLPLAGDNWGVPYNVEGSEVARPTDASVAMYRVVLPGYPNAMGLPLLRGRDFADSDGLDAPRVVLVNERMASRRWPGENPIGKRITLQFDAAPVWLTVVGVTGNAAASEWGATPGDEMYLPYLQTRNYLENPGAQVGYMTLVVRTSGDPKALLPSLREAVWSLNRALPVSEELAMTDVVSNATARPRFYLVLLLSFALVALCLAAVGIYGVISYQVAQRTAELGIRMALGASRRSVLGLVVRDGMTLALGGTIFGLAGALALSRLMQSLLYGVVPTDIPTFVGVGLLLSLVALAASAVPAWRASRIDPQTALRCD